jgi:hypothetical protein
MRLSKIRTRVYISNDTGIDLAYQQDYQKQQAVQSLQQYRNNITHEYYKGSLNRSQYEKLVEKIGRYMTTQPSVSETN